MCKFLYLLPFNRKWMSVAVNWVPEYCDGRVSFWLFCFGSEVLRSLYRLSVFVDSNERDIAVLQSGEVYKADIDILLFSYELVSLCCCIKVNMTMVSV